MSLPARRTAGVPAGGAAPSPGPWRRVPPDPLLSTAALAARAPGLPAPLDAGDVSLWFSGRIAIYHGVRALGLRPGDRVLAPAYSCGSELDALVRAGLSLDFYRVRGDLALDLDDVAERCTPDTRALYVTHYMGFAQPMEAVLALARERGLLVLEDAAHALYSRDALDRPLGSLGHMAAWSFPKTLAVPNGGALRIAPGARQAPTPEPVPPDRFAVAGRMRFLLEETAAQRLPLATAAVRRHVMDPLVAGLKRARGEAPAAGPGSGGGAPGDDAYRAYPDEAKLPLDRAGWGIARLAAWLVRHTDPDRVRERRRANFARLAEALAEVPGVAPLFPRLVPGCCPLFFPIRLDEPKALQTHLAEHGVLRCYRLWSYYHPVVPMERFPFERALKNDVITLSVHQGLGAEDMDHQAGVVRRWAAARSGRRTAAPSGGSRPWAP